MAFPEEEELLIVWRQTVVQNSIWRVNCPVGKSEQDCKRQYNGKHTCNFPKLHVTVGTTLMDGFI